MDEKDIEYLQGLLKIPSVGARGVMLYMKKLRNRAEHTTIKPNQVLHLLKLKNGMKAGRKYKHINGYQVIIVIHQTDPKNSSKLI